ncbi:transcriptional regulator [Nocardiopsis sp. HUAS JQ3]|uniref:transcriptional regulator n=1 Tax=Nocardiopsis sp. HUAS JQ3 TaxID=3061629 RepID=UPI0023A9E040|nr:transcriptional regulator [Nocardiopsis sp. HUAS JQ3]WDZ93055.1 transcriptional regulator [Nocardiopsis sp. HUAS JQ3]
MTALHHPGGAPQGGAAGRQPILETGPRLAMCALLQSANWVDFATVRSLLGVSDPMVSKHSRTLEDAGLLEVRKGAVGRRPKTWFRLTPVGRTALIGHLAWLTDLGSAVDPDTDPEPDT